MSLIGCSGMFAFSLHMWYLVLCLTWLRPIWLLGYHLYIGDATLQITSTFTAATWPYKGQYISVTKNPSLFSGSQPWAMRQRWSCAVIYFPAHSCFCILLCNLGLREEARGVVHVSYDVHWVPRARPLPGILLTQTSWLVGFPSWCSPPQGRLVGTLFGGGSPLLI